MQHFVSSEARVPNDAPVLSDARVRLSKGTSLGAAPVPLNPLVE